MRRAILFLAASLYAAPPPIPLAEFQQRRETLRKAHPNAAIVIFGQATDEARELRAQFFQEANFFYLTGWREPDAALLLTPARAVLFLPHHKTRGELYTGKRWSAEDEGVRAASGFEHVAPIEKLESELHAAADAYPRILTLARDERTAKLRALLPMREIGDATPAITRQRMVKSPAEIAWIQHATEVTMEAHRAGWKRALPGAYEYEVDAGFTGTYLGHGCRRPAYAPIVGSGPNSVILHYGENRRRMDRGETLVMDAAAECDYYASDITRTLPVGGKFSERQRELYDIVLGAQKAALAAMKPGVIMGTRNTPGTISQIAYDYINSHGKDRKGGALGKYFLHGLGHHVGLDVHDPATYDTPLKAGMILTLEPGIYIAEEGIGIRIEDMVLITENGARLLSGSLPREAAEVERAFAAR